MKLMSISSHFAEFKRLAMAVVLCAAAAVQAADYIDFDATAYAAYVDQGSILKTASTLLVANRKLSTVTAVSGDLFLGHGNRAVGKWYPCTGPLAAGANQPGVHYYTYTKTDTEEYAVCQFQGKEAGSTYLMVVDVKFTQVGNDIYAQVINTHYPWNDPYGRDQSGTAASGTYEPDLAIWFQKVSTKTGGVIMSLHNVSFEFADPDLKCIVTYQDEAGNILGSEQVPYGEAAEAAAVAPTKEGYVFFGWDHDLSAVRDDLVVKPVYHKLCTVRFLYPDGSQIGTNQTVEATKPATPPDMTDVTFEGKPFYKWIGDFSVVADDTDFYGNFRFVPQWETGAYTRTNWTSAADNLLPDATLSNDAISYYIENGRTSSGNAADLCNRAVPQVNTSYAGVVGVQGGSVEWTFSDKVYISALNVFTSWGDGARDGIAISQVLYKVDATNDWIEVAGPIDNNAASYGVGDDNSGGALYATLANSNNSFFINGATELKVVFSSAQDHSGTGYVEIEAVGKTETQLAGGAIVTFLDWDGTELKSGKIGFHEAAIPPADPVRDGYKFIGWDADFSDITIALTVNALYHKWCSVTFKNADGTTIDSQTIEETLAATAPDMTGRTYNGAPFLCWDGDPSVISDDAVFTAIYGVLPDYVNDIIATGLVPDGALIWAGGAAGGWDTESRKWATSSGILTTWTDGALAVLPVDAEIELVGERSVSGIQIHDGNVVLEGGAVNLTSPAKVVHVGGGALRFENDVTGNAGITVENSASAAKFMPLGEENAVLLFSDTSLSDIDTSVLKAVLHTSRSGKAEKIFVPGVIDDGLGQTGIHYFKSGEGWMSFECRAILSDWYNNPYIVKIVLKQVGADIYGYVEKAEALESISNSSSIEVTGGGHRPITIETAALAPIQSGAPTHRMAVEYIVLADRDPMWNAATEIAGDYQATGPISIKSGVLKVVDEGTVFGGHCDGSVGQTSPILISDPAVFMFDSSAEQFFATTINGTSSGNGYTDTHKDASLNGRFVIGPNAQTVTFNCSSEGMHRFYSPVDVYGTVTIAKGTYHIFYNNSYGIFVRDGGVLNMNSFLNNYGLRNAKVTCDKGGVINFTDVWSTGSGGANEPLTLDGGTAHMTKDYDAQAGADIKQTALILKNGALIDGVMMTWGRGDNTLTVSGEEPSSVELQRIRFGQNANADSTKMIETIVVDDVTGDEEADLTVSSELYLNRSLTWSLAKATNLGIVKDGAGTLLLTGVSPNFGGSVTLKNGTLAFGSSAKLDGAALIVSGDTTLDFADNATAAFADSSTMTWTADKTLDIQGELYRHTLRVGTDENGLTPEQLAQITYHGKPGRVTIDDEGYLHGPGKGTKFVLR